MQVNPIELMDGSSYEYLLFPALLDLTESALHYLNYRWDDAAGSGDIIPFIDGSYGASGVAITARLTPFMIGLSGDGHLYAITASGYQAADVAGHETINTANPMLPSAYFDNTQFAATGNSSMEIITDAASMTVAVPDMSADGITAVKDFCGNVVVSWVANYAAQSYRAGGVSQTFAQTHTLTRSTPRYVWDASGQLVSIAVDQPCYEYDPISHDPRGLFLNPVAVTNLMPISEPATLSDFSVRGGDVEAGTAFGGADAAMHIKSSAVTSYGYQTSPLTSSDTSRISCYIKMDDLGVPVLGASSTQGDFGLSIQGVLATPESVTHVGNNIYFCTATRPSGTPVNSYNGILRYGSQSGRGFTFTRLQLTKNDPDVEHYVKTSGAAGTVAPDVCDLATLPANYGTVGCFSIIYSDPQIGAAIREMLGDGTNAFFQLSADNLTVSATDGTNTASTSVTATGKNKVAVAWDSTTLKICANGNAVVTATHNGNLGSFASPPRLARGVAAWYSLLQYLPSTNTNNAIATDVKMQELTA